MEGIKGDVLNKKIPQNRKIKKFDESKNRVPVCLKNSKKLKKKENFFKSQNTTCKF